MLSTSLASPMRKPSREPASTCDEMLMFSCPPAMMMSASPALIACAARCVALSPEPHTLLMVIAGTMSGRPARIAAWRAAFWPTPAVSTWPRMTSEICSGLRPRLGEQPLDHVRAQIGRRNSCQGAAELAYRGATRGYDHYVMSFEPPLNIDRLPTLTPTLSRPGGRGSVPSPRLRGEG